MRFKVDTKTKLFNGEIIVLFVPINSPIRHMFNVPLGMDNDAQNISDLFGALLLAHIMLSQDHTVHISWPAKHVLSIISENIYKYYFPYRLLHLTHRKSLPVQPHRLF